MPEEIRITETEYNRIHPDFRGVWSTERYDIPGWEAMRYINASVRWRKITVKARTYVTLLKGVEQ